MAAFAIRTAVERAGIEAAEIEDLVMGCGYPEGTTGRNVARQAALRAGLPVTVGGVTVNRFCASGLQAVADAAARIVMGGASAVIAGGVESCSLLRTRDDGRTGVDPWIEANLPALYLPMITTAAPFMKPSKAGFDRKSAAIPRRSRAMSSSTPAVRNASTVASVTALPASPPANGPMAAPTISAIAASGPTTTWRELVNRANTIIPAAEA